MILAGIGISMLILLFEYIYYSRNARMPGDETGPADGDQNNNNNNGIGAGAADRLSTGSQQQQSAVSKFAYQSPKFRRDVDKK